MVHGVTLFTHHLASLISFYKIQVEEPSPSPDSQMSDNSIISWTEEVSKSQDLMESTAALTHLSTATGLSPTEIKTWASMLPPGSTVQITHHFKPPENEDQQRTFYIKSSHIKEEGPTSKDVHLCTDCHILVLRIWSFEEFV